MDKAALHPNASNRIILRAKVNSKGTPMVELTRKISELGGSIGAIDIVRPAPDGIIRDISIDTNNHDHALEIVSAVKIMPGVTYLSHSDRTFLIHLGGKIEITNKAPLKTRDGLSMAYTPGVARVCTAIHQHPENVYKLTIKRNMVAIVTDGTAVLGLGDIGPEASLPVMEGKAMLFKKFAEINAFPICLNTKNTEEIIQIVKAISPGFGGVNLEDIASPRCFEIEQRLKEELDIPVFHDDQHGTAVVVVAALINALKIVNKRPEEIKIAMTGTGAAGTACAKMIARLGVKNIIGCDIDGAVVPGQQFDNAGKQWFAENTNPNREEGSIHEVIKGADVFLGVSAPKILTREDIKNMGSAPIVFAMANPVPEIMPEDAEPYAKIIATGRSDYPNQINNVLCFPGLFKGALDCLSTGINEEMKMAAAKAIASSVPQDFLQPDYIIPTIFDMSVTQNVAKAVMEAAIKTGLSRRELLTGLEDTNDFD
jgi:malate dehydrogenase (oxaloacetate-decarboxylating)